MHSLSLNVLPVAFSASVLTLGNLAQAQSSEGGTPNPAGTVPVDTPTQSRCDELLARIRQIEARSATPGVTMATSDTGNAASIPATVTAPNQFTLVGYAEALYQWNFNNPSNGITNFRGFDSRHNTFTLSNIALGVAWDHQRLVGRLTLQVGHTPSTYYLGEPDAPGASGANASDAGLWKYLQQAYTGYRFGAGRGLAVTAGLFLSPVGPESIAVHDNWNWSRSNLFFGLPFYHTGVRATYALSDEWTATMAGYNGWNSVVDNNGEKSVSVQLSYDRAEVSASLLYLGGVERPSGAPEGRAWRHLFDSHVTWHATSRLSLRVHANGGFEPNIFGTSAWVASAIYARFRVIEQLFFAVRSDVFYEHVGGNSSRRAMPIFWPAQWIDSETATLDYRPHERASFQLEYRRDHASADMYFGGNVAGDGSETPFVVNRVSQDTLTLGATTWF